MKLGEKVVTRDTSGERLAGSIANPHAVLSGEDGATTDGAVLTEATPDLNAVEAPTSDAEDAPCLVTHKCRTLWASGKGLHVGASRPRDFRNGDHVLMNDFI